MSDGDEPKTNGQLARNEAIKLTATYLNGLAVAFLAIGGLAPTLGMLTRNVPPTEIELLFIVICLPVSVVLHLLGRAWLTRLKE